MNRNRWLIVFVAVVILAGGMVWFVPGLVPTSYQFGPASTTAQPSTGEPPCPEERPEWREARVIEGLTIEESPLCTPDNPYEIAAFVKGTNNVSMATLMGSGLS
ncbi:MAG: multicopper oxidase domain-containing protein, partial [Gammaproteobacteria bacterium]